MKIAVNTRLLLPNKLEGIGWFAYECLKRIVQDHPEHEFYFIFDRPWDQQFVFGKNVHPVFTGPQSRHPVLWYLWFQHAVPRILNRIKPDLFVSPDGYLPLNCKFKTLAVIHDIAYEHYPETVPGLVKRYYSYFFPRFARQATRIATVSGYSRKDISNYYKVDPGKIDVVYNGCDESFHTMPEDVKAATRNKYAAGKPYFFFVGGLYPRKNLVRLIKAFNIFKKETSSDYRLLIAGGKGFGAEAIEAEKNASPFGEDIQLLGRVNGQEELNRLISASEAVTYVSLFEGFGIPCLEAMRCGTAVITSDTSSMPEVCGNAAIYADPFSEESIAAALRRLYEEPGLRQQLIREGTEQQQKFTWDRTASLLWESMEKALKK